MHPMKAAMREIFEPLECPASGVASVPRRFGVGVLLILTTAFAVLFAAMQTVRVGQKVFVIVAVLFLGVTLGQILLFQGKRPRKASLLIGGILLPLELLVVDFYVFLGGVYSWASPRTFPGLTDRAFTVCMVAAALVGYVLVGTLLGYMAGCIMASVFLAQERLRHRSHPPVTIELLPFTAADFDTLISFVHHAPLFDLWSRGRFHYPLDHDQLAAHLERAAGEPPSGLCFKAVCGEMQQMVAYAELANIDRENLRANIDLAIVDPSRNDRDHLSDVLVSEIVQHAFQKEGLQWLDVQLRRGEAQSLECFRKHGFYGDRPQRPGDDPREEIMLRRTNG